MLDKLITCKVCWYQMLYQVLPVAWTNRIATRSDTGSHNMLDLIQSLVPPHYVCNGYLSVICVVFLWIVSIDKAYLNILVVISKLLCQSILGMCLSFE
jgi:hypothetical protein